MIQGSTEWLEFRRTGLGASDMAAILGVCPFRTAYQVYASIVDGVRSKDNFATARGHEWEPVAREYANLKYECSFEPRVAHRIIEGTKFIASLDGDNGDETLESKVPGEATLQLAREGIVPEYYMVQIQTQLLVTERRCAIYQAFDHKTSEAWYVEVRPDPIKQTEIIKAGVHFWHHHVVPRIPPELAPGDFLESKDETFEREVTRYKEAKRKLELAEVEMEACKTDLQARLGTVPGLRGFGLRLTRYVRRGSVQYGEIPELKGVDVERYRKPAVQVFKVTEEKQSEE